LEDEKGEKVRIMRNEGRLRKIGRVGRIRKTERVHGKGKEDE
jgi:uncharacterized protein Veg